MKAMGKSPRLADILQRLQIDRDKYIASHSTLLPNIACTLAIAMDWKSEPTLQKLGLAAFLHDSTLTNHSLAAVMTTTELARKKDQFTDEETKAYKFHPVKAAELVKQFHEIPPDVDTIVLQHHERPDGTGFPRNLGPSNISPLAAVFIVAHDLVSAIFDPNTPFVLEKFIEAKKAEYQGGNFKKLLGHLSQLKL
jgi:HD-GYP domain-containing protein (c-di-GMP phosphodiesterase class II)